jgi:hypothetical protein
MSTQVTLVTVDGRVIQGINYSVNPTTVPANVDALVAAMPGGMTMGQYHIHTARGWEYVPAAQIAAVTQVQTGAFT